VRGYETVNLAVACCRFSDAGKGKLGTILAQIWHKRFGDFVNCSI
jgi:hypothetical protein